MSHDDSEHHDMHAEPHGSAESVTSPFTTEELSTLHADDRKAARNIVLLMVGIFLAGVAMYIVVAYVVAQ